jgi:hypothetical protein
MQLYTFINTAAGPLDTGVVLLQHWRKLCAPSLLGRVCGGGPTARLRSRAATSLVCHTGPTSEPGPHGLQSTQNQAPKKREFPSFRFSPASCSAVSSRQHDEDTAPSASLTYRCSFFLSWWLETEISPSPTPAAGRSAQRTPQRRARGGRAQCGRPRRRPPPRQGAEAQVLEVLAGRESTTTRPSPTAAGFGGGACSDGVG